MFMFKFQTRPWHSLCTVARRYVKTCFGYGQQLEEGKTRENTKFLYILVSNEAHADELGSMRATLKQELRVTNEETNKCIEKLRAEVDEKHEKLRETQENILA